MLLSAGTMATAQHKIKFGITVRAGNYLQADQEHQTKEYLITDYQRTSGVLAGLGLYAERALCPPLTLQAGVHFSQSIFTEQFSTAYPGQDRIALGGGPYDQTNRYTVRQAMLPVQLQLPAGKRHRLAFSIGVAPALAITAVQSDQNHPYYGCGVGGYVAPSEYQHSNSKNSTSTFQMLFSTGLHYRPDDRNSVGLECWLAPKAKGTNQLMMDNYADIYALPQPSHQMRSIQIVLRHSWQR